MYRYRNWSYSLLATPKSWQPAKSRHLPPRHRRDWTLTWHLSTFPVMIKKVVMTSCQDDSVDVFAWDTTKNPAKSDLNPISTQIRPVGEPILPRRSLSNPIFLYAKDQLFTKQVASNVERAPNEFDYLDTHGFSGLTILVETGNSGVHIYCDVF